METINWMFLVALILSTITVELFWPRIRKMKPSSSSKDSERKSQIGGQQKDSAPALRIRVLRFSAQYLVVFLVILIPLLAIGYAVDQKDKRNEDSNDYRNRESELFASVQALKLGAQIDDVQPSTKVTQKLTRYNSIYLVFPFWACSHEIMDFESGPGDTMYSHFLSYSSDIDSMDRFEVSIKYADDKGNFSRGWSAYKNFDEAKKEYYGSKDAVFSIPVAMNSKVRVRFDAYKQGWTKRSPISLIGMDRRLFLYPPPSLDVWLFLTKIPIQSEAWIFDNKDIIRLMDEEGALLDAIFSDDPKIVSHGLSLTSERPDWAIWDFKENFLKRISTSLKFCVHTEFEISKKEIYAISFWQEGTITDSIGEQLLLLSDN